jgi:hypothetical protein
LISEIHVGCVIAESTAPNACKWCVTDFILTHPTVPNFVQKSQYSCRVCYGFPKTPFELLTFLEEGSSPTPLALCRGTRPPQWLPLVGGSSSCLLPPASCLLPPASCLLPPASCLLPPASCLLPPSLSAKDLAKTKIGDRVFHIRDKTL